MQLFNFITTLGTPEQALPEGAKTPTAEDLTAAAAQFSGLLNQAIQGQTPTAGLPQVLAESTTPIDLPDEAVVLAETSDAKSLPTADTSVEITVPAEEKGEAKAPFFPLNIISTLQSLLNPQVANKAQEAKASTATDTPLPEVHFEQVTDSMPSISVKTSSPMPPKTEAVKTSVQENGAIEQSSLAEIPKAITEALPQETKATVIESNNSTDTDSEFQKPASKKEESSDQTAPAADNTLPTTPQPVITNVPLSISAVPVQANALPIQQTAPVQVEDFYSQSANNTQSIQATPEKPTAIPQSVPKDFPVEQNSFSKQTRQAVPSDFQQVANTLLNEAPLPQPEASKVPSPAITSDTSSGPAFNATELSTISVDTALSEFPVQANEVSPLPAFPKETAKTSSRMDNKLTAVSEKSENSQTPIDLSRLQDVSQKLTELNGQVEASGNTFIEALKSDASAADTGMPTITPENPAPSHISFEHMIQSTSDINTTQTSEPAKLPAFLSSAANPADQIVEGTVYSVKNGHQELIIKLNPDNLGEVRVNLSTSGKDGINARLIASSAESHEVLQSHITHLKTSLEAQGIRLDNLSVVVAGNTESSNQMGQQNQNQQNFHQPDSQQQKMSQQDFNQQQQNPFNNQLAFNLGQQGNNGSKSNYAQTPSSGTSNWQENNSGTNTTQNSQRNDNGSISVLA